MILSFTTHPITKVPYFFPRSQERLSVPNARRNPVVIVPGGGGPINPKGNAAFDRDINLISYQFRVTPRAGKTTFTAARDEFLQAIDHGLPQTLVFKDDNGNPWSMKAALTRSPLDRTWESDDSADFQVEWVALSDLLSGVDPSAFLYGHSFKYGTGHKYGQSHPSFALTGPAISIAIDNTGTGARASTTDPVITVFGQYGPDSPSETNNIYFWNNETNAGCWIVTNVLAGETLLLDLASRRVLKNGAPIFGLLRRGAGQRNFLELLPNTVNHLLVGINGAPLSPLNGNVMVAWRPKKGF